MTLPLNKAAFAETVRLVALRIPAKRCNVFLSQLKGYTFERPKVRTILPDESIDRRLLLLAESVKDEALDGLPEEMQAFVRAEGAETVSHTLELGSPYLSADQVLRKLLPGMYVQSVG